MGSTAWVLAGFQNHQEYHALRNITYPTLRTGKSSTQKCQLVGYRGFQFPYLPAFRPFFPSCPRLGKVPSLPPRWALVLGSEHYGVRPAVREVCRMRLKVEQKGECGNTAKQGGVLSGGMMWWMMKEHIQTTEEHEELKNPFFIRSTSSRNNFAEVICFSIKDKQNSPS